MTWNGIYTWQDGLQTDSEMNAYVRDNFNFIHQNMVSLMLPASDAILPSTNAATSTDLESSAGPRFSALAFADSDIGERAAQWTFYNPFASSDIFSSNQIFIDVALFIPSVASDPRCTVEFDVGIAAITSGDASINTKAFVTVDSDVSILAGSGSYVSRDNNGARVLAASDFDNAAVGDLCVLQIKRVHPTTPYPYIDTVYITELNLYWST